MMAFKSLIKIVLLGFCFFASNSGTAASGEQYPFKSGSYQHILENHKEQPFILVLWSITCSTCLKEMELLKEIHRSMPRFRIVMLSVDDYSEQTAASKILQERGLDDLESWIFAEANAQQLRYEIDSGWYGEIPRTYFFNSAHEREGISGALSHKQLISKITEIVTKED